MRRGALTNGLHECAGSGLVSTRTAMPDTSWPAWGTVFSGSNTRQAAFLGARPQDQPSRAVFIRECGPNARDSVPTRSRGQGAACKGRTGAPVVR